MGTKRLVWVDILNIVACAGVLLLHSTNFEIHNFSGEATLNWGIGLFSHSVFLWPVNVFFMLSGFTLIRKQLLDYGQIKTFYKKRFSRIFLPILVWNIFYSALIVFVRYQRGIIEPPIRILDNFVSFRYNSYMWFFVPLICAYLSLPFLAAFVLNSGRRTLELFIILSLVLCWIAPIDADFSARMSFLDVYPFGTRFLVFFVAGYYFGNFDFDIAARRKIYLLALCAVAVMIVGTMWLQFFAPNHYKYFIQYTNLPCTLVSFAVFVMFKYADWDWFLRRFKISPEIFASLSSLSLGIYLIQAFFFMLFAHLRLFDGNLFFTFFVMYIACACSVFVLKRIKYLSRIV